MFMADTLTLDAPRRTSEGFLAVRAKAARTGVYSYTGAEVDPTNAHGLRDKASVNVLRDADTVFDARSVHSFIGKPITDDHPTEAVTAANWRDHARGAIMGAIRDGDHLAFDLVLMDAATIAKVEAGKAELSNGYSATLDFGSFTAPDGTVCDARQTAIVGNHIAIVDRGRAGPSCRIGDAAICDALPIALEDGAKEAAAWLKKAIALHEKHMNGSAPTTGKEGEKSQMLMMEQMKNALAELEGGGMKSGMKMDCYPFHIHDQEKPVKTMTIDGLTVDMGNADTAITTVQTLIAARDTARTDLATKDRELAAKDTEIADLKTKVADQAAIDAMADAKADVVARGKALLGDAMPDTKGKTAAQVRRAVVLAVTKDNALADKSDDYIEARFDGLKDAKPATGIQPLGNPGAGVTTASIRDAARVASLLN